MPDQHSTHETPDQRRPGEDASEPINLDYRGPSTEGPSASKTHVWQGLGVGDDFVERGPRRWQLPGPRERFWIGLTGGSLCSFCFWILVFSGPLAGSQWVMQISVAFVIAKLAIGITFTCVRGWTPLGLGVALSMGVGGLILIGACFQSFSNSLHH